MPSLIVQKYGGSCMATPETIKGFARNVADLHREGHSLIVVVSAMGKTTDQLIELAYQVSEAPNRREMDMLLTTGERVSMALLSMALQDLGVPAISFTGSQAGVFTDDSHSAARIIDIRPIRVDEALGKGAVVVLAGFQGVSPVRKEVTTLGRGGSDTTAVAMAAHYKARRCEVLKDVPGVCSADPNSVTGTRSYKQLSYASMGEMCFWGAKVLHYRSVELAQQMSVPLFVGSARDRQIGTLVSHEEDMFEKEAVLSVNSHKEVHHLQIQAKTMDEAFAAIDDVLQKNHLGWPQVLASAQGDQCFRLMITGEPESLQSLLRAIKDHPKISSMNLILSSVTVTCHGAVRSSLPSRVLDVLGRNGIQPQKMLTTPLSVSVFVEPGQRENAVKCLHTLVDA